MNPHTLAGTRSLVWRVCQFRHSDVAQCVTEAMDSVAIPGAARDHRFDPPTNPVGRSQRSIRTTVESNRRPASGTTPATSSDTAKRSPMAANGIIGAVASAPVSSCS